MPAPSAVAAGRCGAHPWCDTSLSPDQRAQLLLDALTPDERISLLAGVQTSGKVGATAAIPRVGLPAVYVTDGPAGVRQASEKATALPAPIALAATFDPNTARAYGAVIGDETKHRGDDGILGPTVNIMRTPLGGRTFESYGEDPFLVAQTAVGWIEGAQAQGIFATVKHLAANNQEGADPTGQTGRPNGTLGVSQTGLGLDGSRYVENSVVDDRSLHEIYLPAFEAAIRQAHVGAVMCSYNRLDGEWTCANHRLLTDIVRHQLGFDGLVMSDWNLATHPGQTAEHLNAGLDLEMPNAEAYVPAFIQAALLTGQSTQRVVDAHARAILRTFFAFGVLDRPAYRDDERAIDEAGHAAAAERVSESSITLLRNRSVLPLDPRHVHSIAVIGPYADKVAAAGAADDVTSFEAVTPLDGIRRRAAASGIDVRYDDGSDPARAAAVASAADVAVVVAGAYQIEGADQQCLSLECPDEGDQDGLVERVAAAQPRTVAVLETGGPVLTPWREDVAGLLEAWYPGERGGTAIARVLFGDADPGGRLPATFPRSQADEPTAGDPARYPGIAGDVFYKEGVLVGYRWFDTRGLTPAYPFGFGLSYTRFRLGRLRVSHAGGGAPRATVSVDVRNVGRRRGVAVAQLYVGMPQPSSSVVEPPRQLKGFRKVALSRGRGRRLTFALDTRSFSYWDTATGGWRVAPGCYRIAVGTSSRDTPLHRKLALGGGRCR